MRHGERINDMLRGCLNHMSFNESIKKDLRMVFIRLDKDLRRSQPVISLFVLLPSFCHVDSLVLCLLQC